MMIKANGEYLDFNGDVEIESRIKLFEDIAKSKGDFSYDIQVEDNGFNRKILGIPRADTVKIIYRTVPSELIDDTGQSIYMGKLQVNRIEGGFIISTFYAGNAEWFAELSEPMSSLPLYRYDIDFDTNAIFPSWFVDEGLVFPLLDAGALVTRGYPSLKTEDFVPCFYVKTLFNEIFNPKGIKVQGDFIEDPIFKKLIVASNGRSQADIDNRTSYVQKTTTQTISALTKVTFQNESTFPYFDGSQGNFASSTYTADVQMRVNVDLTLTAVGAASIMKTYIYKNGVAIDSSTITVTATDIVTRNLNVLLNAGDTIEVYSENTLGSFDITGGSIKITPSFVYRVSGVSSVPNWSQIDFVSNILRLFNVLPSYNTTSKTLTLDLFNNIKNKPYIDISNEITVGPVDFTEFVSPYGQNNIFKYQESDDEDLREYNISNFISYGSGNLTINNDYIENSKDVVESDFTTPITYLNGVFDMSLERFNFVSLDEIEDKAITSVSNSGGDPRFNMSNASDLFAQGDLVRIETDVDSYNRDWVVKSVTSTYIEVRGPAYDGSATGTATLLRHQFTTDDNVYLFVNIPNVDMSQLSSVFGVRIEEPSSILTTIGIAYFNILSNGRPINKIYKQSLSFGGVNNPLNYQLSLLDTYWPLFSRILNDPVMLPATGYLKRTTFDSIKTFLRPVMVQTEETRNLYYVNRNRGYKGSERPCELELIKLN